MLFTNKFVLKDLTLLYLGYATKVVSKMMFFVCVIFELCLELH